MVNSFSAGVSSFFPSGFLARLGLLGKRGNIPRGETHKSLNTKAVPSMALWFETALTRLLTMRVESSRCLLRPHPEERPTGRISKDGPDHDCSHNLSFPRH